MSEKTLAQPLSAAKTRSALLPLLRRLHFYIGLFIAPFIFVAALTGTLYVLTPQLENVLYAHQLFTDSKAPARPLADQVRIAQNFAGADLRISAVRPAPEPGETTRVMFTTADSAPSESTAVFVDPATLEIRGMLPVYGTSGVLPLRTWLDYLHRNLLLGDLGRNYSELAASWLWIAALGGVLLWATSRAPRRAKGRGQQILRQRFRHSTLGVILLLGLLFFSATGLTWSRWAGDNISAMRAHFGWLTPSVNTSLLPNQRSPQDEHAEHHMAEHHAMPDAATSGEHAGMQMPDAATSGGHAGMQMPDAATSGEHAGMQMPDAATSGEHAGMQMPDAAMSGKHAGMQMPDAATSGEHAGMQMPDAARPVAISPAQFDGVVQAARAAGISAGKIEIRPTSNANKAWTVSEIDRRWPTQVDSVAVNPANFRVMDKVEFAQFGLLAKLTRWGVDAHMGVLFGLPNQLILAAFGLGLCVMIVLGYRLWWLRRPAAPQGVHPAETLIYSWRRLSVSARFLLLVCTVALAVFLPVMGISLLVLLLIDALRWQRAKQTPVSVR